MRRPGQVLAAPDRALIEPCVHRRRPDDEDTQPRTRLGRGASDEFVPPNLEHRVLWLRCTGAMRAD